MRVICDAPGQTCNRLWTYLASVAQCIAEKKKMVIIFYDWTIEDFPNLLHAPFIYYPLWQPWFLRLPKGWGWYKHLTWKVTHNKVWDFIFKFWTTPAILSKQRKNCNMSFVPVRILWERQKP